MTAEGPHPFCDQKIVFFAPSQVVRIGHWPARYARIAERAPGTRTRYRVPGRCPSPYQGSARLVGRSRPPSPRSGRRVAQTELPPAPPIAEGAHRHTRPTRPPRIARRPAPIRSVSPGRGARDRGDDHRLSARPIVGHGRRVVSDWWVVERPDRTKRGRMSANAAPSQPPIRRWTASR